MLQILLVLVGFSTISDCQSPASCNCFECKTVVDGPYAGDYYAMDGTYGTQTTAVTGGCLYRERNNGKIIRACDTEATPGGGVQYHKCYDQDGLSECRLPPEASDYGYDERTWDGSREIQTSSVRYTCNPPKMVVGYNGSANYDIWCSAANFPNWQFTLPGNHLPLCQLP